MYDAGIMNDVELRDVLESAGLQGVDQFTIDAFEAIVEEIAERSDGAEDELDGASSQAE